MERDCVERKNTLRRQDDQRAPGSVLLIHDIVRIRSSHKRFKDIQHDVSKIATHVEAIMWAGNDDDEGYEFAQQAKDSSDDDTLQSASYEVMRKTKTRAPLFFLIWCYVLAQPMIYLERSTRTSTTRT